MNTLLNKGKFEERLTIFLSLVWACVLGSFAVYLKKTLQVPPQFDTLA